MVTVILSHEVKNFDRWKKLFDEGESLRTDNGVRTLDVFQSVDNPNMVTVITEFPGAEAVQGFMSNPTFRETMQKAGVIGVPEVKVLEKV